MGKVRSGVVRGAVVGAALLVAGGAAAAVNAAGQRAWMPLVTLMGKGEPTVAVKNMREITKVWGAALHRLDMDEKTDAWLEDTMGSFEDFNLEKFYGSLPETRGSWRRLPVYGELKGERYKVYRARPGQRFEVTSGGRDDLGDMSAVLRARPVLTSDGDTNYLIHGRFGLGVGDLDWKSVVDANTELLRIAGDEGAPQPSAAAIAAVKKAHPKLGAEDVRPLALFFDAYPAMSELLSSIGRLNELVVKDGTEPGLMHVKGKGKLRLDAMEDRYDEFADFLDDMGELIRANTRLVDKKGRNLFKSTIDTGKMSTTFEFYAKDGQLIPFSRAKVYTDAPVDMMGDDLKRTRAIIDAQFKVMGLKIGISNMRTHFKYKPSPERVSVTGSFTQVPKIKVSGAAMGMFPPGLIDLFIPGNMEQIATDFLTVAAHGNEGRGVALSMQLGKSGNGAGAMETTMGFEALNNFFVKFGMGIAADRILPDEDEQEDMERFAADVHAAFVKDLDRFARR